MNQFVKIHPEQIEDVNEAFYVNADLIEYFTATVIYMKNGRKYTVKAGHEIRYDGKVIRVVNLEREAAYWKWEQTLIGKGFGF